MDDPGQLPRQEEGGADAFYESMRLLLWEFPALLAVWFLVDPESMSTPEVAAMLATALENSLLWYHSETSNRSTFALTGLSNVHPRVRQREFLVSAVCYAMMTRRLNAEYSLKFRVGESAPMLMRIHGALRLVTRRGVFECMMVPTIEPSAEDAQDGSGRHYACLWMPVQDQDSVPDHVYLLWRGERLLSFDIHVQESDQNPASDDADTDLFSDANSDLFDDENSDLSYDADTDPF